MGSRNRSLMSRIWWVAVLLVGGATLLPVAAQAQARGTLQVFAQAASTSGAPQTAVSTLARVSVAYPTEQRSSVVLTIDYSSN